MTVVRVITEAKEVSDAMLDVVASCVEDRFPPGTACPTEEFIDRLCWHYADGWDIEDLDTNAVRKIMLHVRKVRREMAA